MSESLIMELSVAILLGGFAVLNLGFTIINLKLYTEIMKEKSQRERKSVS